MGGALLGANNQKQSGIFTVLWLQSTKLMTMFILVPVSAKHFLIKKSCEILKSREEINEIKKCWFLSKNHTFLNEFEFFMLLAFF